MNDDKVTKDDIHLVDNPKPKRGPTEYIPPDVLAERNKKCFLFMGSLAPKESS